MYFVLSIMMSIKRVRTTISICVYSTLLGVGKRKGGVAIPSVPLKYQELCTKNICILKRVLVSIVLLMSANYDLPLLCSMII